MPTPAKIDKAAAKKVEKATVPAQEGLLFLGLILLYHTVDTPNQQDMGLQFAWSG